MRFLFGLLCAAMIFAAGGMAEAGSVTPEQVCRKMTAFVPGYAYTAGKGPDVGSMRALKKNPDILAAWQEASPIFFKTGDVRGGSRDEISRIYLWLLSKGEDKDAFNFIVDVSTIDVGKDPFFHDRQKEFADEWLVKRGHPGRIEVLKEFPVEEAARWNRILYDCMDAKMTALENEIGAAPGTIKKTLAAMPAFKEYYGGMVKRVEALPGLTLEQQKMLFGSHLPAMYLETEDGLKYVAGKGGKWTLILP